VVSGDEVRDQVRLTNLDQPLFEGAQATKRDLVDYLDAVRDRILPELSGRPLSVIRVLRGQRPFMQKNLPKYAPPWVRRVTLWAESSRREVAYALCEDRRSLLWFANQRAVEYHPTLVQGERWDRPTHLVLDIDPPAAARSRRRPVRSRRVRSGWIRDWRRRRSSATTAAAGCSWTPRAPVVRRSWRRTARARDPGRRCRSRWPGRAWTR
jgi:bifunctional non-homologous end joining protein LigD